MFEQVAVRGRSLLYLSHFQMVIHIIMELHSAKTLPLEELVSCKADPYHAFFP